MFPNIGREGEDDTREWVIVHPYVLLYEVDETAKIVRILRLWHTSQNYSQSSSFGSG
ncbi:type II toxin-antitoxin system RelE/ParE family toxin [Gluconobacter cerinus]|uniref:type II toxin-antitoxin system RelE/ParE family toxin n=1 Tax=Gluconobacter cerinus TaxID=38307 RepID=UPI001B8D70DA|nr:type II toxin-antitoxin system RelE/ParE family toxin [Gluconobacter cerinus]MBS1020400.1 type II toxin-antitoxin system RelE/ParE family toxin [Gluconobacter cerinus]